MKAAMPNQSLFTVGESLTKDSQNALYRVKWPALLVSLDAYPLHCFSEAGRVSLCKRYAITDEQLEAALLAYVPVDAPTEAERRAADLARVLGAIEAAVKTVPKDKRKGGKLCA